METWSYNITPQLRNDLIKIEDLRNKLLLTPLAPRLELLFRWEGTVRKTYWSLSLSGSSISRQQVESIFMKAEQPRTKELKEVVNYKEVLDYAAFEWVASDRPFSLHTLQFLHEKTMASIVEKRELGKFRTRGKTLLDQEADKLVYQAPPPGHIESLLSSLLAYLNLWPVKENPILISAIAQIQIIRILPFEDGNGRVARLLSLLVLYKFGFDCKGMLCLEEQYRRDLKTYHQIVQESLSGNLTGWIEYFAQNMLFELENIVEKIQRKAPPTGVSTSFAQLPDRQKAILALFDKPGEIITNRKVQKHFRISQITAARDLGKLKTLGLLISIGKGRSTSYRRF